MLVPLQTSELVLQISTPQPMVERVYPEILVETTVENNKLIRLSRDANGKCYQQSATNGTNLHC